MFGSVKLHPQLVEVIDNLGYLEATPVQEKVIPIAIQGRDLLVSAKTGSGKTAAFMLPSLNKLLNSATLGIEPRLLILLPTRELALQTFNNCKQFTEFSELSTVLLMGGEDFKQQLYKLSNSPDIIVATLGRLVEHIENESLDLSALEILVLDEADRILEMGFSEDLLIIASACNAKRQTLFFSATLKNNTLRTLSEELLKEPQVIAIDNRRDSPEHIRHQIILADDVKHKKDLVTALLSEQRAKHVIVFCNTRSQCRQLGNYLLYKDIKADFLHGDIAQSARKKVLDRFRNGHNQVLVATDVAARGLDMENIDLVINFESPFSAEDYIHRCGRTGRAGKEGAAVTLISSTEWNLLFSIERYLRMRFEKRKIKGLEAHYKGPKKLKKSGKAAGTKKKRISTKLKSKVVKSAKKIRVKKNKTKKF
ncbi:MAG: DEAD/DEAH box helicase [Pseudomonadota bacterium]